MWSFPWYITVIGMLLTCTLAQLDGSFWWKKNVQVKSLANIDNEHSAKIRTLSPVI